MILIKQLNGINRLRLTFVNNSEAAAFYAELSRFAQVRKAMSESTLPESNVEEHLERTLDSIGKGMPQTTSWTTEWPTKSLEGLVRLCLIDPNFPGYVKQVHNAMKKLTLLDKTSLVYNKNT
ncbi:unnamed protein product [Echinostoma caproni]|uniref:V-type proton ATPase subunit C n=1 Tax=Echinostoma caproni TaxID=27848 RepID=A0A183A8E9_9TREM|nr:unnamed protein product [Echinostoma caproni]